MVKKKKKGHFRGIDSNYKTDFVYGLMFGIAFWFINRIIPSFAIGFPSVELSFGRTVLLMVVVGLAPFEEVLFRGVLTDLIENKVGTGFTFANIIQAIVFGLFHYTAYGGNLTAVSGSFISAMFIGWLFGYMSKYTDSQLPNMVAHAILNFTLVSSLAIVF